jgi:hypothetical protein
MGILVFKAISLVVYERIMKQTCQTASLRDSEPKLGVIVGRSVTRRSTLGLPVEVWLVPDLKAEHAFAQDLLPETHDGERHGRDIVEREAKPPADIHERRYVRHHVDEVCRICNGRRPRRADGMRIVLGENPDPRLMRIVRST